jgi:SAM-dependent methyltransferase
MTEQDQERKREAGRLTASAVSGEAYEPLTGRWSRLIAPRFVRWLDVSRHARWIDVGCGTGALIESILASEDPAEVVGVDPSSSFIAYARRHIGDPRVRYEVGDARSLPVASRQYDAVVAGLVLNHIPALDLHSSVAEMARAARPGGIVGAYVWDYAGGMEPRVRFWEAATAVEPAARNWDERSRYPLCHPDQLKRLFVSARLNAVETISIEVEAQFSSFDDYWQPFLAGYGVASDFLATQPDATRDAIRDRLRDSLPVKRGSPLTLGIRAWAVQGIR